MSIKEPVDSRLRSACSSSIAVKSLSSNMGKSSTEDE
jgi:hypothetical protein